MDFEALQRELVDAAVQRGHANIRDISNATGVYPGEVPRILEALGSPLSLAQSTESGSAKRRRVSRSDGGQALPTALPFPHPHDSDWRYTRGTADRLARKVLAVAVGSTRVLLLGVPRLFLELARTTSCSRCSLYDTNAPLIRSLNQMGLPGGYEATEADLGAIHPSIVGQEFSVAVCDPPWYPADYQAFIRNAALGLKLGGTLFVSLLPLSTRPSADRDRAHIVSWSRACGLYLEELLNRFLLYETPPFEAASLRSQGITLSRHWRPGDLLVLRKVHNPGASALSWSTNIAADSSPWFELVLGQRKIKLRGPFEDYDIAPRVSRIEANDLLPTVSRRYSGRRLVDLWFWDNRVYGIEGKAAFKAALAGFGGMEHDSEGSKVPPKWIERARSLLSDLLAGSS